MKLLSKIGWEVFEYLRRAAAPFFLKIMFGMTMLAVSAIENTALNLILMVLLTAGDFVLDFFLIRAVGESAYKMNMVGRLLRENKPTGSGENAGVYRPCKEYRGYKGFVIGLVVCAAPIVLVLVGALAENVGVRIALMLLCGWCYLPAFSIYQAIFGSAAEQVTVYMFSSLWWSFVLIALDLALFTVAYIMGGSKEKLRQYTLARQTESIEKALGKNGRVEQTVQMSESSEKGEEKR